ncbi:YfcC family protein [Clostridium sp. D2Q-14]|uniref:YfcC family protein n=1 Tax=Anaeromonas gelatinilytica TaxID=2683194 RepID=UPI00193B2E93|nr:YfcC family protein [Anaeromonas gelatinilytica]MBS4536394.1 YfcC family protein [Anaeromonas gelatinilytica]
MKFKMPSAYSILIAIIIVVAILTWVVPAGQYEENEEGAPIPGTYEELPEEETTPQGISDVMTAPIKGFYDAVDIALFVLAVGGFLGIVMKTGAIDAGIAKVVEIFKGKESWMIIILMALFAIGGSTYGMAEESIAFYPLIVPIFIAAGYDAVTGVSVILLGAGLGVLGSTVNPFATGVASGFADVPLGGGIGMRLLILFAGEIIGIIYTIRYAKKVKEDPSKSLVADMKEENEKHFLGDEDKDSFPELTGKRILILALFALTFVVMIYGVLPLEDFNIEAIPTLWWWFEELTALFLVAAIVIGIVYAVGNDEFGEEEFVGCFVNGARDLLGVALIVGVSRGITVVMNAGNITATVLHAGETTLAEAGSIPFIILTYLFYIPLSFLIPSTSGLATVSMPIMAPLGDFANVARTLVITAYQSASGIVNLVTPTSAVVMGGLAIGRVPYSKWLKYVWKLLAMVFIMTILALMLGVFI